MPDKDDSMTVYGVEAAWEITGVGAVVTGAGSAVTGASGAVAGADEAATGTVTGADGAGAMTVGEDVPLAVTAVLARPMLEPPL